MSETFDGEGTNHREPPPGEEERRPGDRNFEP